MSRFDPEDPYSLGWAPPVPTGRAWEAREPAARVPRPYWQGRLGATPRAEAARGATLWKDPSALQGNSFFHGAINARDDTPELRAYRAWWERERMQGMFDHTGVRPDATPGLSSLLGWTARRYWGRGPQ